MLQIKKNKIKLFVCSLLLLALSSVVQTIAAQPKQTIKIGGNEYSVYQNIRLKKAIHGLDGRLELLRDARITEDVHIWETDGYAPSLDDSEDEKTKEMFKNLPPRKTILRLVDARGKTLDSAFLKCIKAEIETVRLYSTAQISYQLTCNFTNTAPYEGAAVSFVEIEKGRLRRLEAIDKKTGKKEEMEFVDSHRCGWSFTRAASGRGRDILRIYTIGDESGGFSVRYERFHFDGKRWVRYERKVKEDYWEDEDGFPKASLFPKAR